MSFMSQTISYFQWFLSTDCPYNESLSNTFI